MRISAAVPGVLALCLIIGTSNVRAQEEAVPQNEIPKAVMDALLAKFPKALIDKCTRAREGADLVYDIEFRQEGRKCEADITGNGTYINYEKAIDEKGLPKAVTQAVKNRYPKSVLKEVMEETEVKGKEEKLAAYEVVLRTAEKQEVEVRVSPGGEILEDTGKANPAEKK
jgi:hypothetical protein